MKNRDDMRARLTSGPVMSMNVERQPLDVSGLFVMGTSATAFKLAKLDDKGASLDGVDEDVPAGEACIVGPGADKVNDATVGHFVILWVDVKVGDLLDRVTRGV